MEPTSSRYKKNDDTLETPRSDLSGLWMGGDNNIESTFLTDRRGKLEQLWISAISDKGSERFVYCNQGLSSFNPIPADIAEKLTEIYQPIIKKERLLSDAIGDIAQVLASAQGRKFWIRGVGDDIFSLPEGLTTRRQLALIPSFEAFAENPTLGRNLFGLGGATFDIGVFIHEKENFSLISFPGSIHKIPGAALPAGTLREFTFSHANMLVDGAYDTFFANVGRFRVMKTWVEAGGPDVMHARPTEEGAVVTPFRQ